MKNKFVQYLLILIVLFSILLFRLFQLTIISGTTNREFADKQRIRLSRISAPRGILFDRNGTPLVRNIPVFKHCLPDKDASCSDITREEALTLELENKESELLIDVGRSYPYKNILSHVLGYLGEVNAEELTQSQCSKENKLYSQGDLIGRTGIEQEYECSLKGKDGAELIEVNINGTILRKIGRREPIPGKDINLSIDLDLQTAAYKALMGTKGAIVVTKVNTGEVLALASSPAYDPDVFSNHKIEGSKIMDILSDSGRPLFNRAISGVYPPGSTFKIIIATAGLEENKFDEKTVIEDTGVISVGSFTYSNWYFTQYGKTEGSVNIIKALQRSNDIFFYKAGEMITAPKIVEWANKFGVGKNTGINLPGEVSGYLPDISKEWYLGNTYHLAIGQGALGTTPLQVNQFTSVIASKGKLCLPNVVKNSKRDGECLDIKIKKETINLITKGMIAACSSGGTAYPLFGFIPQIACKTGTAEIGDAKGTTHAWLTAFAPAENPEIVVTALVEEGGEGSVMAAPMVKKVLETYFKK